MLKMTISDSGTGIQLASATLSERLNSVQARDVVNYLDDSNIIDLLLALPYASRRRIMGMLAEIHGTCPNAIAGHESLVQPARF